MRLKYEPPKQAQLHCRLYTSLALRLVSISETDRSSTPSLPPEPTFLCAATPFALSPSFFEQPLLTYQTPVRAIKSQLQNYKETSRQVGNKYVLRQQCPIPFAHSLYPNSILSELQITRLFSLRQQLLMSGTVRQGPLRGMRGIGGSRIRVRFFRCWTWVCGPWAC